MKKNSEGVFGQGGKIRVGLYARVSTHDQQTLPLQLSSMREYAERRNWIVAIEMQEIGSGAKDRPQRAGLMKFAKRREIDLILVWRLDRWGRSVVDLLNSLQELHAIGVGFASLTEALDFTTPGGRAMAGLLAVFAEFEREILRDRVKAGIAEARKQGKPHGRPRTALKFELQIIDLKNKGHSNRKIATELNVSRTSVIRILGSKSEILLDNKLHRD